VRLSRQAKWERRELRVGRGPVQEGMAAADGACAQPIPVTVATASHQLVGCCSSFVNPDWEKCPDGCYILRIESGALSSVVRRTNALTSAQVEVSVACQARLPFTITCVEPTAIIH
jgi:hypothetical protein